MVEEMKLYLKNLGPINSAKISMSKITVVGGPNASGKSSLSKFIYSFLKANSFNRQEIAYDSFLKQARNQASLFFNHLRKNGIDDKALLSNFSTSKFSRRRYKSVYDLIDIWEEMVDEFRIINEIPDEYIDSAIDNITETSMIIRDNSNELYSDLMKNLLNDEFHNNDLKAEAYISNDLERIMKLSDKNAIDEFFKNRKNFKEGIFASITDCKKDTYLNYGGIVLKDVFYIDSLSILDVFTSSNFENHLKFLKNCLTESNLDIFDNKINDKIIDLEESINKILHGYFVYEKGEFNFISSSNVKSQIYNTASGIKQIGIIQLLLANRQLKDNCVLIIDEPEVNLHPEWQMKFAEILTLIASRLNVSIYINTHSPLFVEAVNTFADYYDLSDETTYHLAERKGDLYDIHEIPEDNLSKLYDNLGRPYLKLDMLKIQKELE